MLWKSLRVPHAGPLPGQGTAHRAEKRHLPADEAADLPGTGGVAVLIVLLMSK